MTPESQGWCCLSRGPVVMWLLIGWLMSRLVDGLNPSDASRIEGRWLWDYRLCAGGGYDRWYCWCWFVAGGRWYWLMAGGQRHFPP
ncbi:hypothetical protein NG798_26360 [Ancylothrix sp. C2]|uniref:hypothetical protein n=1 Tax=Ancylothrix sp. D3o TaxID=2953691 RepID=UPI0021BA6B43|nr:hypothetical protein [Ancylothrix sp. D3o]MCT7953327.1 hypothetical protein [Ancylothrix sp. D3o]